MAKMAQGRRQTWDGLHVSPRTTPSKGARLCTHQHWSGSATKVCELDVELPMSSTKLRAFAQFSIGPQALPIEPGRFVKPRLLCHLHRCNSCSTRASVHMQCVCPAVRCTVKCIPTSCTGGSVTQLWPCPKLCQTFRSLPLWLFDALCAQFSWCEAGPQLFPDLP